MMKVMQGEEDNGGSDEVRDKLIISRDQVYFLRIFKN